MRKFTRQPRHPDPLPPRRGEPAPCGPHAVQVLRTYPAKQPGVPVRARRRAQHRPRLPEGARRAPGGSCTSRTSTSGRSSAARALADALRGPPRAARRRRRAPLPRPRRPRSPGPPPASAASAPRGSSTRAGGDRVLVCDLENDEGTPIYVHAKVCIVDDVWMMVGSDNMNRRSWTHDSELSCAVLDDDPRRAGAARSRPGSATAPGARARHPAAALARAPRAHRGRPAIDDLLDPDARLRRVPRTAAGARRVARTEVASVTDHPGHVRIHRPEHVPAWHRVVGARGVARRSTTPTGARDGTSAPTAIDRPVPRRPPYRLAA